MKLTIETEYVDIVDWTEKINTIKAFQSGLLHVWYSIEQGWCYISFNGKRLRISHEHSIEGIMRSCNSICGNEQPGPAKGTHYKKANRIQSIEEPEEKASKIVRVPGVYSNRKSLYKELGESKF